MKIRDIRAAIKCLEFYKDIEIDIENVRISHVNTDDYIYMLAIRVGKDYYPIDYYKKEIIALESVNNLEENISFLEFYC